MPGLLNSATGEPLPLTSSEITSCVQGYAFGLMASLTYANVEVQPFQGLFVYPLDEYTTVVGFEAIISERAITVHIKDKNKLNTGFSDIHQTQNCVGRITLDEDLERIAFVANLGIIGPLESVSIFISTSSELQTLPNGAVRVLLPTVCVPLVSHSDSISSQQSRGSRNICMSKNPEQLNKPLCLTQLLDNEVANPMEYDFNFQLEIRGPCLLAGVESPTHEIRADAAPYACSAKSIIITLANKHTFDRPVEILIHPTEPHIPHILMEQGDMTHVEFEQHLKERSNFAKGTKKMISSQRKMEIIRRRLHKDIPHHSVLMLNFCPDLWPAQPGLRKTNGEFIFLIDRSGSMSGVNINRVKDALVLILKSLMPTCLFNIIGFGSTFKTLFPSSQVYSEENLATACDSIQHLRADMGGTNILSPLKWITRQPIHVGHPRLLFLLTDGSVNNTGKVLELLRYHAFTTRCYSFGIGSRACPRLVQGLAAVSKGSAEFLMEGERLQPKMIKSLKKAMAPVLSDVTVEWIVPENAEVLISPVSSCTLFPGDRLVGYGIVCNYTSYQPGSRVSHRPGIMRSQKSRSSVFFNSQEEGSVPESGDYIQGIPAHTAFQNDQDTPAFSRNATLVRGLERSLRRRAYSATQIPDLKSSTKNPTASDSSVMSGKHLLRKTRGQDRLDHITPEPFLWQAESQSLRCTSPEVQQGKAVMSPRKSMLRSSFPRWSESQARGSMKDQKNQDQGDTIPSLKSSSSDSYSLGDSESSQEPSYASEMEPEPPSKGDASSRAMQKVRLNYPRGFQPVCKAVVKGMKNSKLMQWEIDFDLDALGKELQIPDNISSDGENDSDLWKRTFHHLAAKAIIRDFEQLAEMECEIEPGSGHRYQVNAVHTSKACNVISKYTAFVPVDLRTRGYLPTMVDYVSTGCTFKPSSLRSSFLASRKQKGLAMNLKQAQFIFEQDSVVDGGIYNLNLDEPSVSCSPPPSARSEKSNYWDRPVHKGLSVPVPSLKASETLFGTRLNLNKSKLLARATKGMVFKQPPSPSKDLPSETESMDYSPLVSLQLASGAFVLNLAFCGATGIPMEKLKWTSPFACHRVTLATSHNSFRNRHTNRDPRSSGLRWHNGSFHISAQNRPFSSNSETICHMPYAESILVPPNNSPSHSPDRTQEGDNKQILEPDGPEQAGKVWATAVALGWLENNSASYFVEWELVAAKANTWLGEQEVPEGRSVASVKAAAQQLFVLLRHWDENLEFNLLCYNPNSV